LIASLYVILTYLSAVLNLAFGPFQFRLSEGLTLLPMIWGDAAVGVTLGTFLSNLGSPYGVLDWVFGTLATFLAASLVAWLGRRGAKDWLGAFIVAGVNALIVPVIIIAGSLGLRNFFSRPNLILEMYLPYAGTIFVEEFCVVAFLGIPLLRTIKGRVLR
jgi:uncharacterized membrane protein